MDYSKMTQAELEEKRMDLIQIRDGFSPNLQTRHRSEIEDEIAKIDGHLNKFE